eukprot:CAMPEP_0113577968 /NCGR_PEP_ID=MMETSP0015_2-20120614/29191_1 /TAXON_ID=2838 /ORGANISM="Odontella" /LENGTH=76 /DNA_ID=CAMNT_0000481663 /DNA_START=216 /DNA_END=443 /DNA_ORIENTATION=+ /assembly_acc=CAM_ASM_000160
MGDVAHILSREAAKSSAASGPPSSSAKRKHASSEGGMPPPPPPPPPRSYRPSRAMQQHGTLPRDALDVLTDAKRRR